MRTVKMNLVRSLVLAGFGVTLIGSGVGCATTGGETAAMTPGEAEQVVSEECVGVPTKERELPGTEVMRWAIMPPVQLSATARVAWRRPR